MALGCKFREDPVVQTFTINGATITWDSNPNIKGNYGDYITNDGEYIDGGAITLDSNHHWIKQVGNRSSFSTFSNGKDCA